jgi:FkbM family methyltransferase
MLFKHEIIPSWLSTKSLKETGVVIFGAGAGALWLMEYFNRVNVKIFAFLDSYKHGNDLFGYHIYPITTLCTQIGISSSIPLIISVLNNTFTNIDNEQIRLYFINNGWLNVCTRYEWHKALFMENYDDILSINDILSDDKSRYVYSQALILNATNDLKYEPEVQNLQYFPNDIPGTWNYSSKSGNLFPLKWVQGGAFTGDSVKIAVDLGLNITSAYLFEPDIYNFQKLVNNMKKNKFATQCIPCALWNKIEVLKFLSGKFESSKIDTSGTDLVLGTALDSFFFNTEINYVTLDVEGAEINSLLGMESTIAKYKPDLAICIYHKPDDWWLIPKIIFHMAIKHSINYKFYLRVHFKHAQDSILYAIKC